MDEINVIDILKSLNESSYGLDKIHVTVSENIKLKLPSRKLTISKWMEIYKGAKTSKQRANIREIAIKITELYGSKNAVSEHGTFASKFESSLPYNFFLTTVFKLEETFKQPYSLSFHEIIDYTGGEIVDSLHFNGVVDLLWIATEYMLAAQYPKMTVICGLLSDPLHKDQIPFDINIIEAEIIDFGCHHSKFSIFKYKNDSIRIVVSTANFDHADWGQWTQGLWVSPALPPLPDDAEDSDGESITHFKKDFTDYLNVYQQPELNEWKSLICRTDCSAVKVIFFASVPKYHEDLSIHLWGHKRLSSILEKHATLPNNAKDWPIVAQSSAVGFFGGNYERWLLTHIVYPMAKEKDKRIIHIPEFRFLYPTTELYDSSFDKQIGRTSLSYYKEQHLRQKWFDNHLYHWTFEKTGRNRAMPHCKSYTRMSPDQTEIAWFVLTSANLSRAGWGKMIKHGTSVLLTNYEAGVVFIPEIMINRKTFPITKSDNLEVPLFLLPYDIPISRYEPEENPALIPGDRPVGTINTEAEENLEKNLTEKEEKKSDEFFNDERVKKILRELLTPEKVLTSTETENKLADE